MTFESMPKKELEGLHSQLLEKYNSFKAKNLKLDMSRGKPCTQQLDLSMDMLKINDVKSSTGLECRNYGILDGIVERVKNMLEDIQKNIFEKARAYRDAHVYECDNYEEFKKRVKDGGFFLCHWDGTAETEAKIKEETQATIRCVPFAYEQTPGVDMVSGKPAVARVIIARSY